MNTQPKTAYHEPTQDEIATYAYYLWEAEGRPDGRDLDYWLQAKAQLIANRQYEAGLFQSPVSNPTGSITVESPGIGASARSHRDIAKNKGSAVPSPLRKPPASSRKTGPSEQRVTV